MISVPEAELKKLEEARCELVDMLTEGLSERDALLVLGKFSKITGIMWRVANTKNWEKQ